MLKGGFTADTTEVADLYFQVLPIALILYFWSNVNQKIFDQIYFQSLLL
jgi:hypothetical protein